MMASSEHHLSQIKAWNRLLWRHRGPML